MCDGLVRASPDGPGDDKGGLDASLRQACGDVADFLDRPANEGWRAWVLRAWVLRAWVLRAWAWGRRVRGRRGGVFCGAGWFA